ncbi:hypothetical protein CF595_10200 [Gallibacterium anatis]|nr:hypothetical protein CF595_10200 [Gallibacterium anatis]
MRRTKPVAAPMVARVYLRVSTDAQDLERQEAITTAAKAAGYYVAGIYREKASGARADRPELLRMIGDLQPGEVVIAEKIDRISRLPLPEAERLVADLDLRRAHVAVVEHLALAHGDDLALDRLLGGRIRDHDTTGGDLLFLGALDDDAVVQRLDVNRRAYLPRGATHRLYRAPPRPCARAKIRRLIASGNHPCRGCQAVLY